MFKSYFKPLWLSIAILSLAGCDEPSTVESCDNATQIQVCFSPDQNCTQMLIDTINGAQHSIYAQAYSFTSYPIAKALVAASERGVSISILVDKSDIDPTHFSVIPYLKQHNINLFVDDQVTIAHNKVMIFDNTSVETGSFNFTKAAQGKNAENMLIIHNKDIAEIYLKNWQKRLGVSQKI